MHDPSRVSATSGSASTLSTVDEGAVPDRRHISALDEIGMGGIANTFQFISTSDGSKIINWISELVARIIE